jgi:hypothetical protein
MTNILDRIKKELEANAKIINAEIPGGLPAEDMLAHIAKSPKASKVQTRNELLLTRKLELEAILHSIAIDLGYKTRSK